MNAVPEQMANPLVALDNEGIGRTFTITLSGEPVVTTPPLLNDGVTI